MRWFWIILWTYLIFVLQSGFAHAMPIGGYAPHLLLAGLTLMTVRTGGRPSLCLAAAWGMLSDCLTDGRFGADLVGYVLVAFVIGQCNARWDLTSPARAGVVTIVIVGVVQVASIIRHLPPDGRLPDPGALGKFALGSALYTGLLVALVSLAARIVWPRPNGEGAAVSPAVFNKWRMLTG